MVHGPQSKPVFPPSFFDFLSSVEFYLHIARIRDWHTSGSRAAKGTHNTKMANRSRVGLVGGRGKEGFEGMVEEVGTEASGEVPFHCSAKSPAVHPAPHPTQLQC